MQNVRFSELTDGMRINVLKGIISNLVAYKPRGTPMFAIKGELDENSPDYGATSVTLLRKNTNLSEHHTPGEDGTIILWRIGEFLMS